MAFTKFDKSPKISTLPNRPSDAGYDAMTLKAAFDYIGEELKKYINETLTEELDAGATNIAVSEIEDFESTNVQDAIVELLGKISTAATGFIADHSLVAAKMSRKTDAGGAAVGTDNIAAKAVTSAELASDENSGTAAVGEHNIQPLAVQTGHIANGAITGGTGNKIAQSTISKYNMGTNSVGTDQLENGSVTGDKISSVSPVPYAKTSGVQAQHLLVSGGYVTLSSSNWSGKKQTVSVPGVLATDTVFAEPWVSEDDGGSEATYHNWVNCRDYGIRCVANKNDELVFACDTVPTGKTIWFNVVIFRDGAVLGQ